MEAADVAHGGPGEVLLSGSKCKTCSSVVVTGAYHCAFCGSRQGMRIAHKMLLALSAAVIGGLFFIATRPPTQEELEYTPPRPPQAAATAATPQP